MQRHVRICEVTVTLPFDLCSHSTGPSVHRLFLRFRLGYRGPQIPAAETQNQQTVAERRQPGAFLCRLLWNDAGWKLPGNSQHQQDI